MRSRGAMLLCGLLALSIYGCVAVWGCSSTRQQSEAPINVVKQPVAFAKRTFDPAIPPADMPALSPGENAECDSNFLSNASVRGETRRMDGTHATISVTHISVALQLNITIWVPTGATPDVLQHEEGHRQVSEFYYQTADKLAERIASTYVGKRLDITGADLSIESSKVLQRVAAEITDEYNKELNPGPTQLLYDSITDHGRNGVIVKDAVDHAIKNAAIEATGANTIGQ